MVCKPCDDADDEPKKEEKKEDVPKALPAPKKAVVESPEVARGVNVTILGADSPVGHYTALLLKQCPCVKRIRLYEAKDRPTEPERDICKVVHDLQHIDTNCVIQAYGGSPSELSLCLQNSHIVLMLESDAQNLELSLETRFYSKAPLVKKYADAISQECPQAFTVICISPVDCMVPLAVEIFKDTGFHDPRKLLGTMSVAEMRASTLAARALSLEPRYTRVPCVGGTEGETLVPLFSKAVEFFDFARHNAELMTETVRYASKAVAFSKSADLSEAHAHAGLVKAIAYALLCQDVPRVTGFVESDSSQIISPAKYIANEVELDAHGISNNFGVAPLSDYEMFLMHLAITELNYRQKLAEDWKKNCIIHTLNQCERNYWFTPKSTEFSDVGFNCVC
ncbi:malate dehydrogenase, mitochondrial-like [Hyposmocoma kahamanoa]|uniref:malate dehydrogenase, mitochondrial-like n=1 Tax=Hyposmocoma kahamanoa TaxID=1477025 RepID=UPI000E6D82E7|nr:malate dehydrogenase, mitochondrial-like [Hyposmocoma kahamanoa]